MLHGASVTSGMGLNWHHASDGSRLARALASSQVGPLRCVHLEVHMGGKQKTGSRPAYKRRIVLYDLNDMEREALKQAADKDAKTISRWVADAVRERLRNRK